MRLTVWPEKSARTGTYSARYYDPETGKKARVLCQSYKEYQEKATELRAWLKGKRGGGNTAHPLKLFDQYLEAMKKELRPSTLIRKESLRPFLARYTTMEQLTVLSIETWQIELTKTYKISTVSYMLAALKAFIKWCRRKDLSTVNPFEKIPIPAMEEVGRRLSQTEINNIFATMEEPLKPLIVIFLETGCRRDELIFIQDGEIDLERKAWTIPKSRSKTKRERMIPLTENALNAFARMERGWTRERLHKAWKRALKSAGVQGRVRIHDLRHTFASDWRGRGDTLKAVCGWTSDHMMNRYKHVWFEEIQADMRPRSLGAVLGQSLVTSENNDQ